VRRVQGRDLGCLVKRMNRDAAPKKAELAAIASAMLEGRVHLIEGVRKITELRHEVGCADDEIFMPIRAIESETDHFPAGAQRSRCSKEYLARADAEVHRYLEDAKSDIFAACREILRAYGEPSGRK